MADAPGGVDYNAAKRIGGRKRRIVVDTDGGLLTDNPATADVQDGGGVEEIFRAARRRWPWLKHLFANGACDQGWQSGLAAYKDFSLKIVCKLPKQNGFQVLFERWVMECMFGRMMRCRRLVSYYKKRLDFSDAMIHLSMDALLLRRVA